MNRKIFTYFSRCSKNLKSFDWELLKLLDYKRIFSFAEKPCIFICLAFFLTDVILNIPLTIEIDDKKKPKKNVRISNATHQMQVRKQTLPN